MASQPGRPKGRIFHSVVTRADVISVDCPYCGGKGSLSMVLALAFWLRPEDYAALVELGFCRNGNMLYLPLNDISCCTLRLLRVPVEFTPSPSQRRAERRLQRFLEGDLPLRTTFRHHQDPGYDDYVASKGAGPRATPPISAAPGVSGGSSSAGAASPESIEPLTPAERLRAAFVLCLREAAIELRPALPTAILDKIGTLTRYNKPPAPRGELSSRAAFLLARHDGAKGEQTPVAAAALARQLVDWAAHGARAEGSEGMGEASADVHLLPEPAGDEGAVPATLHTSAGFIHVRLAPCPAARRLRTRSARAPRAERAGNTLRGPFHLDVEEQDPEDTDEAFDLYHRYQREVHGDSKRAASRDQFRECVVVSPLAASTRHGTQLGTRWRCYRLRWPGNEERGRLVAISVIDCLPHCVNSMYFVWDPALKGLSLGTTSILDELRWVAAASARTPSLRYLYLGFYSYCHPRLEYKLQFKPNQLLCPYTLHWVPSDKALPRMTRGSESAPLGNLGFLSWLLAPDRGASKAQAWERRRRHAAAEAEKAAAATPAGAASGGAGEATPERPAPAGDGDQGVDAGAAPPSAQSTPPTSCPAEVAGMTVIWQERVLRFETLCMITQPPPKVQDALLLLVQTLGRPLAEKFRYLIPGAGS